MPTLEELVGDVASAIERIDADRPIWSSVRTGRSYLPGFGPLPETEATRFIAERLAKDAPDRYGAFSLGVRYPSTPQQRCDWVIGDPPVLAVEVKLLRIFGDNGKPNDNALMHILSPYPAHRSALTDIGKLTASGFDCPKAILIYGFEYDGWPLEPTISGFERLSSEFGSLSARAEAPFQGLIHPVHRSGKVFVWNVGC